MPVFTDEQIEEFANLREFRHAARIEMREAFFALTGREGMTKEEQTEALEAAVAAAQAATNVLTAAVKFAKERDFAAYKEAKTDVPAVFHLYPEADTLAEALSEA